MSYKTVIVTFVTVVFAAILAHPTNRSPRFVDLSEVINKTVCPIEVVVDEDPNRVPQRIKMMKCAKNSLHWCKAQSIPDHECCHHQHSNHVMECVEMRDTVVVFYKGKKEHTTFEVSVGCTCMIEQSTDAPELPPGFS